MPSLLWTTEISEDALAQLLPDANALGFQAGDKCPVAVNQLGLHREFRRGDASSNSRVRSEILCARLGRSAA